MTVNTIDSLGNITWWGFTPALNLIECLKKYCSGEADIFDDINILCVGMTDSRHILRTLSSNAAETDKFKTFYVVEAFHETYARMMLQLYTALECSTRVNLQDKTEFYLEIFGNIRIRDVTYKYLINAANDLIRLVTNLGCLTPLKFSNLTYLKFKERDMLESILKFWRGNDGTKFDAGKCWDYRLRKHLGTRYDAIPNIFDWDCSITLHDRKATTVNAKEYAYWRQHGMAFELREANYNVSNRSLASGRIFKNSAGDKGIYWGYWGDIICSPFLAFGIDTSECCALSRLVNGKHAYAASTISEVNVRRMLWQLENHEECPLHIAIPFLDSSTTTNDFDISGKTHVSSQYDSVVNNGTYNNEDYLNNKNDNYMYTDTEESKEEKALIVTKPYNESTHCNGDYTKQLDSTEYVPLDIANTFEVNFLPCDSFLDLPTRYRSIFLKNNDNNIGSLNKRFRIIYIGNSLVHLLSDLHSKQKKMNNESLLKPPFNPNQKECDEKLEHKKTEHSLENDLFDMNISDISFTDLLEDEALLIVESILYIVTIRSEQIKTYCENVRQMAHNLGFEPVKEINPLEDHHLYFRFKRKSD
ncbi:Dynein assembly factor 3, axonemal [Schistosoma japonicum]|nr:Dynein assembly factor 3, axonemal [Schistosoma japonicum]